MQSLQLGTLVHARYRIVQLLGQGGFGVVYEAIDEPLAKRVALKQLLHTDDRISRQFKHEARLLANLNHAALPRVTDYFSEANGEFLVMDYVPGDDLMTMLQNRETPFPVYQVLPWGLLLLDALHYLHTRQPPVIHRDIKPQNLKVQADGSIILLDFGLAKGSAGEMTSLTSQRSLLAYTRGFAPPEQVEGTGTDARSDLYALGATLYCLLTNSALPESQTRILAAARGQPDPLHLAHSLNPQIPKAVSRVLRQSMALSPTERPSSAQEMRVLLEKAAYPDTDGSRPVSQAPNRQRLWGIIGGAVVLAILVVIVARATMGWTAGANNGGTVVAQAPTTSTSASFGPTIEATTTLGAPMEPSATTMPRATVAPTTIPVIATPTHVVPTQVRQIVNLSSRATASSSSVLDPEQTERFGLVRYDPSNVLDRNPATAWVEGHEGTGIGEHLALVFPQAVTVTRLGINIGLDIDPKLFTANNRVRRARLMFSNGSEQEVEFQDQNGLQFVLIADISTTSIVIIIEDIYPGERYNDTAIAEVEVWGYE